MSCCSRIGWIAALPSSRRADVLVWFYHPLFQAGCDSESLSGIPRHDVIGVSMTDVGYCRPSARHLPRFFRHMKRGRKEILRHGPLPTVTPDSRIAEVHRFWGRRRGIELVNDRGDEMIDIAFFSSPLWDECSGH